MTSTVSSSNAMPLDMGVTPAEGGADVAVFAANASRVFVCLFNDEGERETTRVALMQRTGDVHHGFVPGIGAGTRYGLRADGPFEPAKGHRYDPAKLLVDPYARLLDRPFRYVPELSAPRSAGLDTAPFVPRAVVLSEAKPATRGSSPKGPPGLIYEVPVKALSMHHPGVRVALRGTLAALAEPAAIDHLHKLGVTHVELMPIAAWMDERHLPPLGLANAWGYNPIVFGAPDPRIVPGGMDEARSTIAKLHQAGISVILDVVYNHTAESDAAGPTVSLRGLDNAIYYRHAADGSLVNDTACGNTLACDRAPVIRLVTDCMRRWVEEAGVDGFRFDLATTLGRSAAGFSPEGPLLAAMLQDPLLRDTLLIAEPWDIGAGGYRLGGFPAPFLEWSDRYRDDVRRFWKGEVGPGALATRLAGSSDVFQARFRPPSASVNFVACHDGFALADIVAYERKHNEANGENNRDGTNDNHSWNNGVEGVTNDPGAEERRLADIRALLACLFLSRGTPMLTAGDEFGRTQRGNNNAYCQDNEMAGLDWADADDGLLAFVAGLSHLRGSITSLKRDAFYAADASPDGSPEVQWLDASGQPMTLEGWRGADVLIFVLSPEPAEGGGQRYVVAINRSAGPVSIALPRRRRGRVDAPPRQRDGFCRVRRRDRARARDPPGALRGRLRAGLAAHSKMVSERAAIRTAPSLSAAGLGVAAWAFGSAVSSRIVHARPPSRSGSLNATSPSCELKTRITSSPLSAPVSPSVDASALRRRPMQRAPASSHSSSVWLAPAGFSHSTTMPSR